MHSSDLAFRRILSEYIASMPYTVNRMDVTKSSDAPVVHLNFTLYLRHGTRDDEIAEYQRLLRLSDQRGLETRGWL